MQQRSEPINIQEKSLTKQLLLGLFTVVLLLFCYTVSSFINIRHDTGLNYDDNLHSVITTSEDWSSTIYMGSNWIFLPNVSSEAVRSGAFVYESFVNYQYAEHVSVSTINGWNDLGSNAVWYNTDKRPDMRVLMDGRSPYNCALYMTRLILPPNISTINISTPNINGYADIYCNGSYMGSSGFDDIKKVIDISGGTSYITLTPNDNHVIELIIAVRSHTRIYAPGIASFPELSTRNNQLSSIIISSIWMVVEFVLMIITLIGGGIISKTFHDRHKYFTFIALQVCYLLFTINDSGFLVLGSLYRLILSYCLVLATAFHSFNFVSSVFRNSNANKKSKLLSTDRYIVATIAVVIIVALFIRRDLFATDFPHLSSTIFSLLVTSICIYKVLFIYINHKHASIALCASVVSLFAFIDIQLPKPLIYNIPTYSIFVVIEIVGVDLFFILQYVNQYNQLKKLSEHLQILITEKTQHISQINRDLLITNKRLLENEEARKNVLSNVSHDLRTPITAIRGYAELMLASGSRLNEDQRSTYLENIIKRASQMENLVSDIMELTKMENNAAEFKFIDLSLCELLEEQNMLYQGELEGTKKKITFTYPDDDLLIINADPRKFVRVLSNLISNAINYSKEEALIEVTAYRNDESKAVCLSIKDNGIGIPEDALEHIFDRFYRASNSGQNIRGTGLGLSIVKTVIDHHRGTITVESVLNEGTTFHITLPEA